MTRANPGSADIPGILIRAIPPFPQVNRDDNAAWAEMLARIGRQNCRLSAILEQGRPRGQQSQPGRIILEELEKERTRIARDLHAGAGQPLAGIKMNLELIDGCLGTLPQPARDAVQRLRTLTDQALAQVRAVSHRLHPPAWQELTTGQALRNLIDSAGLATRMEAAVEIDAGGPEPDHGVKVALYRCAQECLSNIARHAGATRFEFRLRREAEIMELVVRDNGRGLDAGQPRGDGIGLVAIREHAEALGGTFGISSGPGGTTVTVRIPAGGE